MGTARLRLGFKSGAVRAVINGLQSDITTRYTADRDGVADYGANDRPLRVDSQHEVRGPVQLDFGWAKLFRCSTQDHPLFPLDIISAFSGQA